MDKLKPIFASAYSAAITVAVIITVTIAGELSEPFKNWLAGFTGHHWVTKSWLTLIVFAVFYALFRFSVRSVTNDSVRRALWTLFSFVILGFVVLLGFYVFEFF